MHPVIDTIMLILFVIFMIAIFGGYHSNKFKEREAEQKELERRKKEQELRDDESQ